MATKKMTVPQALKTIDELERQATINKALRAQVRKLTRERTALKGWITRLKNAN